MNPNPSHLTEYLDGTTADPSPAIARAAAILRARGTVAFPTETVYGLGANALDPQAVARIFTAKQRPSWDPLIVHVCDPVMLASIAVVSPQAQRLMDAFWPGPLTLLLPRTPAIPDAVTSSRPLVGVRMPAHPLALALIRATGLPIAAPSANRFGHTSPTTAAHVLDDLDGRINAILDGGPTSVGLESTVFDPATNTLYRPGAVTPAMLETITGPITLFQPPQHPAQPESLPSPGVGIRHYAPHATLLLVKDQSTLDQQISRLSQRGERVGVMLPHGWSAPPTTETYPWAHWDEPSGLAHRLFSGLRHLDQRGVTYILCPLPEAHGIRLAIRDRLLKAARTS